ncbi:MAG: hypothetical protein RL885_33285 [Planctomycetota bacterium]
MPSPALRPLDLREIFDRAFELYRSSIAVLLPVALTIQAAAFVASLALGTGAGAVTFDQIVAEARPERLLELIGLAVGNGAIQIAFSSLSAALLVSGLDQAFWDRPVLLRDGLRCCRERGLPMLATLALLGAIFGLCLFAVPALALWLLAPPWSWLFALAGLVLGGLVALFLGLRFALAPLVVLIERQGASTSLRRGAELLGPLRGDGGLLENAWLRSSVLILGPFLLQLSVAFVAGALSWLFGGRPWEGAGTLAPLVSAVTAALLQPFVWALLLVHYYDRRVRREGLDLEIRARSMLEELAS